MWIVKRYTFWTEHLHCNYSRGHCKHIDTEHSVNIVHAVGIMQHAKLHNGITLCPAREPFREMFIFSIACIFKSACTVNLIKGYRFFVLFSINRNFITHYTDITQQITEDALCHFLLQLQWLHDLSNTHTHTHKTPFLYYIFLKIFICLFKTNLSF